MLYLLLFDVGYTPSGLAFDKTCLHDSVHINIACKSPALAKHASPVLWMPGAFDIHYEIFGHLVEAAEGPGGTK